MIDNQEKHDEIEAVRQTQKARCATCHKPILHFDAVGIHEKCRYCKSITTITWEEIRKKYHEFYPENMLSIQTA